MALVDFFLAEFLVAITPNAKFVDVALRRGAVVWWYGGMPSYRYSMCSTRRRSRIEVGIATILMLAGNQIGAQEAREAQETGVKFDIKSQPLVRAVNAWASQAGRQIVLQVEDAIAYGAAPSVHGKLEPMPALRRLLEGTGLTYSTVSGGRMIAIHRSDPHAPVGSAGDHEKHTVAQLSQNEAGVTSAGRAASLRRSASNSDEGDATNLEEIFVTGSRLLHKGTDQTAGVQTFDRDDIDRSGQTTIADFLNTVPGVSLKSAGGAFQSSVGATSVTLHGLPIGSTLVLLNGRRVVSSPAQHSYGVFFDLNNIPLAAVERVEIVSVAPSAVYGSDAIGGVVNIVLKNRYDGLGATVTSGASEGSTDSSASFALGQESERGAFALIGSYQSRTALRGFDRADIVRGVDPGRVSPEFDLSGSYRYACDPENVYFPNGYSFDGGSTSVSSAAVPRGSSGSPTPADFADNAGSLNSCARHNPYHYADLIPATERVGLLLTGQLPIAETMLVTEMLYSETDQSQRFLPSITLLGGPNSPLYTVDASNPHNPFGESVNVSLVDASGGLSRYELDSSFARALVGVQGSVGPWSWEVATLVSQERSKYITTGLPNSLAIVDALSSSEAQYALNPFVEGPSGSASLVETLVLPRGLIKYRSQTVGIDGFAQGDIFRLPAGPVSAVVGAEYRHDDLLSNNISDVSAELGSQSFDRASSALFAEARLPLLEKKGTDEATELLTITLAARYDHYSDFGGKTTPQYGFEIRPTRGLLFRGAYSHAFKAPSLHALNTPVTTRTVQLVPDPSQNNAGTLATVISGGNPALNPERGVSSSFGFMYSSTAIDGLRLSLLHWRIDERDSIQALDPLTLLQNEALFPSSVVRDGSGDIVSIRGGYFNLEKIHVRGVDGEVEYSIPAHLGELTISVAATHTYRYASELVPGSPAVDGAGIAQDSDLFAPKWKASIGLQWTQGSVSASVLGRYTGSYKDYHSVENIGDFWFVDARARLDVGSAFEMKGAFSGSYIAIGAVNLFNQLPQNSAYSFGTVGYDPSQSDLRGRFLYAQAGLKF